MLSFEEIQNKIECEINNLHFPCPPESLYEPIRYILSLGGKRLRPSLALMAYNLYREDVDSILHPAIALEVFHNFTLLHDDLMDKASLRRNHPTVHKLWGENTAVLSGDAMLIAAYQLIGEVDISYMKDVFDLFTTTALEVCGGQQYDMEFESRMDVTEEDYMEMIRLKTAVLLACSLKIGAILGGASNDDADKLYQFGINMGLAFQLQDDLLDVYGDTETLGKNIGGDIICNKKTFLLINALQRATEDLKSSLIRWLTQKEFDANEKIAGVTNIYNVLGLKELLENRIRFYYAKGMDNLRALSVPEEKLVALKSVVSFLMSRQF